MICPRIHLVGLVIQNTRPKDGLSCLGHHGNIEIVKSGPSPGLDVVQVKKQRQNSHAALPLGVEGNVVVVAAVEKAKAPDKEKILDSRSNKQCELIGRRCH